MSWTRDEMAAIAASELHENKKEKKMIKKHRK